MAEFSKRLTDTDLDEMSYYHAPTDEQKERMERIADGCAAFLRVINENAPDSADKSSAIRKVREARMSANSAIALDGAY